MSRLNENANDKQMDGPMLVLDLPAPMSVNRTRRINYQSMPAQRAWKSKPDALFLLQKRSLAGKADHRAA